MNKQRIENQLKPFIFNTINKIKEEHIPIQNELIIQISYLNYSVGIYIDNPNAYLDDDEADYLLLDSIEVEEWKKDVANTPSLSDDDFFEQNHILIKSIVEEVNQNIDFTLLNPTLPFQVFLKQITFPSEILFSIEDTSKEFDGDSLRDMLQENYAKTMGNVTSQYQDMVEQAKVNMQQMMGNTQMFSQFEGMDLNAMMSNQINEFVHSIEEESGEFEILYHNNSNISTEQKRALAIGAIMKVAREESLNSLQSHNNLLAQQLETLKYQWEVFDTDSALTTLDWLKNEGHSIIYSKVKNIMDTYKWYHVEELLVKEIPILLELDLEDEELLDQTISKAYSFYDNMLQSIRINKKEGGYYTKLPNTIIAWDMGRLVNLACWSFECGFITEEQAWSYINFANLKVKEYFSSWAEFAHNYLFGRGVWNFELITNNSMKDIVELLLHNPQSPWVILPF